MARPGARGVSRAGSSRAPLSSILNGRNAWLEGARLTQHAGTNGWMCLVEADGTPMCLDKEWQAWADGWMNKKDPQVKSIGLAYMLKGDKGASNSDPYAEKATPDNQWVVSGPHVMVVLPDPSQLDALPTDPWNGGPWVMWKGTKYAHIMMPTVPTPKPAAAKSPADKPADKK